jgi:REP element-mobilizing transposase RayT
MWNDTEIPLAYLVTLRCYGTWLHGDIRGSVDRNHNAFGTARLPHEPSRKDFVRTIIKHDPVELDSRRRSSVEKAVVETCVRRNWHLHALNVRTNHAHIVAAIGAKKPEQALIAFKANSTRQMREDGCWNHDHSPWAEKGSKRRLWNERSVANAIDYVLNGQGDDLPEFD